jgi:hypothetical protein
LTRLFTLVLFAISLNAADSPSPTKLPRDDSFFPLAVWLQSPRNAERFKAAGINTYVGLWRGPTQEQFSQLKAARLKLVCHQNEFALEHKGDPTIIAWMQDDEPDNAQSMGQGKGYGPPVLPEKIMTRYNEIRAADSSRPILLNLGQAVAWDNYIGRGVRRNHPEDYAEYVKGGDIVSFDIYPITHPEKAVRGQLDLVANGVKRLKTWAGDREVWNCVEAKVSEEGEARLTADQLRSEVWMSIIQGTRGIIYFVHHFKPTFSEASIFDDPDLLKALTEINRQVTQLAPILNSSDSPKVNIRGPSDGAVAALAKRKGNDLYLFTVSLIPRPTAATFMIENVSNPGAAEVLDESRRANIASGAIEDKFDPYQAHLYKLTLAQ